MTTTTQPHINLIPSRAGNPGERSIMKYRIIKAGVKDYVEQYQVTENGREVYSGCLIACCKWTNEHGDNRSTEKSES